MYPLLRELILLIHHIDPLHAIDFDQLLGNIHLVVFGSLFQKTFSDGVDKLTARLCDIYMEARTFPEKKVSTAASTL